MCITDWEYTGWFSLKYFFIGYFGLNQGSKNLHKYLFLFFTKPTRLLYGVDWPNFPLQYFLYSFSFHHLFCSSLTKVSRYYSFWFLHFFHKCFNLLIFLVQFWIASFGQGSEFVMFQSTLALFSDIWKCCFWKHTTSLFFRGLQF